MQPTSDLSACSGPSHAALSLPLNSACSRPSSLCLSPRSSPLPSACSCCPLPSPPSLLASPPRTCPRPPSAPHAPPVCPVSLPACPSAVADRSWKATGCQGGAQMGNLSGECGQGPAHPAWAPQSFQLGKVFLKGLQAHMYPPSPLLPSPVLPRTPADSSLSTARYIFRGKGRNKTVR